VLHSLAGVVGGGGGELLRRTGETVAAARVTKARAETSLNCMLKIGLDCMNDVGCSSKENTTKLLTLLYSFKHQELI